MQGRREIRPDSRDERIRARDAGAGELRIRRKGEGFVVRLVELELERLGIMVSRFAGMGEGWDVR